MASQPFSIDRRRRTAWAVLALMLVAAAALSALAARRGWSSSVVAPAPAPAAARIAVAARFDAVAPPRPTPAPAAVELAAPGSGTTGTIALPALPDAAASTGDQAGPAIVAARPFAFGRAPRTDRIRALECLTAAVYYEAAGEPDAGQAAVAQVVLNRVRHPAFPASVCGVVYQGSEKAGCQFSFACDGSMPRRPPAAAGWARAVRTAAAALAGHVYAPIGLATHYHSFAVTPAWNRSLVMTDVVGAHFFHRWKGWWGTAAAFRQLYAGGEPLPGPHTPLVAPALAPDAAPVIALAAPVPVRPVTPRASVQPAWRGSGAVIAAPAADDHLPQASTILPEWRESGRPLR